MIKEAIEKVLSLAVTGRAEIHGLECEDLGPTKGFAYFKPPVPGSLSVNSLDGLVNLLEADFEGLATEDHVPSRPLVHVIDFENVAVLLRHSNKYAQRPTLITAAPLKGITGFPFNDFTSQEKFIIGLQSCFEHTDDLAYLIELASHIDSTEKVTLEDTGAAQIVTTHQGIAFKEAKAIKGGVKLAPYRTFRDVDQPVSEFIFRVRDGGSCGLYEADGGRWKLDAINAIAAWLTNRLHTSLVTGIGDTPVIS